MITGYRSISWPARLALVLAIACTGAATLTAPVVSAAPGASAGAKAGAPKVNIVESDQTGLEMYFKPYAKDEGGRVAVPNVEVIAMPEYHGVSEDGSERTIDKRLTVVVQDRAHQFWPVIMRLSKKDAAAFYDGLDQAAKMREDSGKFAKLFSKGDAAKEKEILADIERTNAERGAAVLNMRHGALKLQDENMASLPKEAVVQVRMPGEMDHRTTIWINGAPDGAGWYMVVYANQQTVETLRDQLGRILGRRTGAPASAAGNIIKSRLLTAGLAMNQWQCAELAANSSFKVSAMLDSNGPAGVMLSLVDGQTERTAAEVVLTREAAKTMAGQIRSLIAERQTAGKASKSAGTMEACVAALPYTIRGDGSVDLPVGIDMQVLPVYRGVRPDGANITDERVTIVANDGVRSFWPLLARVDDDVARKLAEDLLKTE